MTADVRGQVYELIGQVFVVRPADIDPSLAWEQLGADSLDLVEFVMALRDRFELEIEPAELEQLRTVDDVVAYVEQRVAA